MNIEKQIVTDLYEVIKSQNKVISYLVVTERALMNTFANDAAFPNFAENFQRHHSYYAKHQEGQLAEALAQLERMLGEVGEKLKRDTGGWQN